MLSWEMTIFKCLKSRARAWCYHRLPHRPRVCVLQYPRLYFVELRLSGFWNIRKEAEEGLIIQVNIYQLRHKSSPIPSKNPEIKSQMRAVWAGERKSLVLGCYRGPGSGGWNLIILDKTENMAPGKTVTSASDKQSANVVDVGPRSLLDIMKRIFTEGGQDN